MIIGVIEIIVMNTIDAMIKRHIVDKDKHVTSFWFLDFNEHNFLTFGSMFSISVC
jgi:hypothetical protein